MFVKKLYRKPLLVFVASLATNSVFATDVRWNTAGGNWSDSTNWTPAVVPGPTDSAWIGASTFTNGETVSLDQIHLVSDVRVYGGAKLDNEGNRLTVLSETAVFNNGQLDIRPTGPGIDFATVDLGLSSNGTLNLHEGAQIQVSRNAMLTTASAIIGVGVVRLDNSNGVPLGSAGTIRAGAGLLEIDVPDGAKLKLDGAEPWMLYDQLQAEASNSAGTEFSNLTVNGGTLTDPYSSKIRVTGNAEVNMNLDGPWEADAPSEINFTRNLRFPGPAYLRGANLTTGGLINVANYAHGVITADTTFAETANVVTGFDAQLDVNGKVAVEGGSFSSSSVGDSHINLAGHTTWSGTITNDSLIFQSGNADVSQSTVVNGGTLDLDGQAGTTVWDIKNPLTLNVDSVGLNDVNVFGGAMNVGGNFSSRLEVNLSDPEQTWEMDGQLILGGNVLGPLTRLSGSPVSIAGELTVAEKVDITADLDLSGASTTTLSDPSDLLQLSGASTILPGATFVGKGVLQNVGHLLLADGVNTEDVGIVNQNRLAIDNGPGSASVGKFNNSPGATLAVDLGGVEAKSTAHDRLVVAGPAELNGQLDLSVAVSFAATPYEPLTMLLASGGSRVSVAYDTRRRWALP